MLAFRTGLSTSMCEAWIEEPIAKSAEAIKAAFLPASDDNCVIVARSEIEAYALARVKKHPGSDLTLEIMTKLRHPLRRTRIVELPADLRHTIRDGNDRAQRNIPPHLIILVVCSYIERIIQGLLQFSRTAHNWMIQIP
jgi:hypothetical protein